MEELQSAVSPELDLIETRVIAPLKEFQGVLKTINKTITKREHKVGVRYGNAGKRGPERHRSSLTTTDTTIP